MVGGNVKDDDEDEHEDEHHDVDHDDCISGGGGGADWLGVISKKMAKMTKTMIRQ